MNGAPADRSGSGSGERVEEGDPEVDGDPRDLSRRERGHLIRKAAANPFPSRRGSSSSGAKRRRIAGGSRSEPERLP